MKRALHRLATLIPAALFFFGSCSPQDSGGIGPSGSEDAAVPKVASWRAALIEHREAKDTEYSTSSTSPMAGTQYLKSEPGERVFVTREDKTFGLAYEAVPDAIVQFERVGDDAWRWKALAERVVCRVGDAIVPAGTALDGLATLGVESLRLRFYPSDDRVTLIVFDPDRPEMTAFEHLVYFPPDAEFAVGARLVELAEPEEIEMLTSRNLKKTFYRYAKMRFRLDGADQELTAFKYALTGEDSKTLFIPFRDRTSGEESYGAGRFLEIDEPNKEPFVMDFNRSFNPLCNYSPAYNCAIPPRENHLDIAIRAGERTYPSVTPHAR